MSLDKLHITHYLIILAILCLGISGAMLFAYNDLLQFLFIVTMAILYAVYGVVHHYLEHDLTIKIVIEYVLVALLIVAIFVFTFQGR